MVELTAGDLSVNRPWVVSGSGPVWRTFVASLRANGVSVILHRTKISTKDAPFVKSLSAEGVPVLTKRFSAPETQAFLDKANPALVVVLFSDEILKAPTFERLPCPVINFHPSDLPRYRGPSPFYWQLMAGESSIVLTFHRMEPRIDAGPICFKLPPMPVLDTDDSTTLIVRSAEWIDRYFAPLFTALNKIAGDKANPSLLELEPQDESQAFYQGFPSASDLRLNWSEPAEVLIRKSRAASQSFPVWAVFNGMPVRFRFQAVETCSNPKQKGLSGQIIRRTISTITVQTSDPAIALRFWRPRFYTLPRLLSVALQFVLLLPGARLH